jgi:hypothetical protein
MHAYNYDLQAWVHGLDAVDLMIEQVETELALLRGDSGDQYAASIGVDRDEAIQIAQRVLRAHT